MHSVFFNLLLVFLPTQLGLHTWPAWAMVLGRRVDFLSPTIYLTDILTLLTVGSWILYQRKKLFPEHTRPSFNKPLLLLFFAGVNIYFASNRIVAIYAWLKVFEYALLGYYIVKTKPKISAMLPFLSIGVLYSSVIAITQFVLQRSVGGALWFLGERTFTNMSPGIAQFNFCVPLASTCTLLLRSYGTFPHPNVFGGFLAIVLPLIISQIKNKKQLLYIIVVFLGAIALAVTFSRSAWIAFFLSLIIVTLRPWKQKKYFVPTVIMLVLAAVFVVSAYRPQEESMSVRRELNNSAIAMFMRSPVLGVGLGNFLVELPKNLPSRQIYFLQPVHNIFLLVLSETGIIGFALCAWFLVRLKKNWTLIIVVFLGLIDHYFLTLQQGQLLLTILLSSTIIL